MALKPAEHALVKELDEGAIAPNLLARHLEFCSETAARLPIQRLIYPRSLEFLPELGHVIESSLARI